MRFRFCGDADAPDWILAEITVLAKMSSVRMKLICRQILNQLLGIGINYDKLLKLTHSTRIRLDSDEVKALVSSLHFIFVNSAKYDVDGSSVLPMELQQLGMPRDITMAIASAYQQAKEKLRESLLNSLLTFPRVSNLSWRVDYLVASSYVQSPSTLSIRLQFELAPPSTSKQSSDSDSSIAPIIAALQRAQLHPETLSFIVTPAQFKLLYNDLKQAKQILQQI